jgi:hypothetical protein
MGAIELAEELNERYRASKMPEGSTRKLSQWLSSRKSSKCILTSQKNSKRSSSRSPEPKPSFCRLPSNPSLELVLGRTSKRVSEDGQPIIDVLTDLNALRTRVQGGTMLLYLNKLTWNHSPEGLISDIVAAQRAGVHIQLVHEMPSQLDQGSDRYAVEFDEIIAATPPKMKPGAKNTIYNDIAVHLKPSEWRNTSLALLGKALVAPPTRMAAVVASARRNSLQIMGLGGGGQSWSRRAKPRSRARARPGLLCAADRAADRVRVRSEVFRIERMWFFVLLNMK